MCTFCHLHSLDVGQLGFFPADPTYILFGWHCIYIVHTFDVISKLEAIHAESVKRAPLAVPLLLSMKSIFVIRVGTVCQLQNLDVKKYDRTRFKFKTVQYQSLFVLQ